MTQQFKPSATVRSRNVFCFDALHVFPCPSFLAKRIEKVRICNETVTTEFAILH